MKKFNLILNTCLTVSILCSSISMQGMKRSMQSMEIDSNYSVTSDTGPSDFARFLVFSTLIGYLLLFIEPLISSAFQELKESCKIGSLFSNSYALSQAKKNEEYNSEYCLLTKMPAETLFEIFSHCPIKNKDQISTLENSIKTLMKLSYTCKKFNRLLTPEKIGDLCKNYTQEYKDQILKYLISCLDDYFPGSRYKNYPYSYNTRRLPALILICAGANADTLIIHNEPAPWVDVLPGNASTLLEAAIFKNDAQFVEILLKHHANPNTQSGKGKWPVAIDSQTTEIAQLFIENGVDLTPVTNFVLRHVLASDKCEANLIPFYIQYDANLSQQIDRYGCILHWFVHTLQCNNIKSDDNFLKKAEYLINAIPNEINTINGNDETPLDQAKEYFSYVWWDNRSFLAKKLINLLQKYGALTAKELKEESHSSHSIKKVKTA